MTNSEQDPANRSTPFLDNLDRQKKRFEAESALELKRIKSPTKYGLSRRDTEPTIVNGSGIPTRGLFIRGVR